jgi:predicted lipoprotein with Yx(FWY)xxD motif
MLLAVSGALASSAAAATPKPTLQLLRIHSYGSPRTSLKAPGQVVLIAGNGFMVYGFSTDKPHVDSCQNVHQCLAVWPPVLAPHKLVLGRGVNRTLVHSIRLRNGKHQLTYNGWPLYLYVGDTNPKQTSDINIFQFGGLWPAVSSAGKFVPSS